MRFRSSTPTNWINLKEEGRRFYDDGRYEDALQSYRTALNPEYECPPADRQILLSNIVACRLKIGGDAQVRAAVEDAKQCVAINPSWSKGHVRLASAYIALGGYSNDACNALQTALRHDPSNTAARQMLIRELRRDHAAASAAAPDLDPPENPDYVPPDDAPSWQDRLKYHQSRLHAWYNSQSEDMRTVIKIFGLTLILYVAFGGRFGLEALFQSSRRQGNYDEGNAYDRYRRRAHETRYFDPYYRESSYTNMHSPGGFLSDSSGFFSLAMLVACAYMFQRNGVNPFHALWLMNMMGAPRRRVFYGGFGGFGRPRRHGRWY